MLGLFRRDVYLQGGWHGGVDKAANDGGNLLLDGGLIAVGMAEVLQTVRESITSCLFPQLLKTFGISLELKEVFP